MYEIIGIAVGGVIFILIILFSVWVCYRKSKSSTEQDDTAGLVKAKYTPKVEPKSTEEAPLINASINDEDI